MARFQFRPILVSDSRDEEDYDSASVSLNVYRCLCKQVIQTHMTWTGVNTAPPSENVDTPPKKSEHFLLYKQQKKSAALRAACRHKCSGLN